MGDLPTPEHIMQIGLGFWASKTLLSAVEMEVFTELAKHPEDLDTLQGRLGLHPRSARDFLDALVAMGLLKKTGGLCAMVLAAQRRLPVTDADMPSSRKKLIILALYPPSSAAAYRQLELPRLR